MNMDGVGSGNDGERQLLFLSDTVVKLYYLFT